MQVGSRISRRCLHARSVAIVGTVLLPCSSVASQQTTTFNYDALGRLTSSTAPDAAAQYTYDAAGNRSRVKVTTTGPIVLNADFENPQVAHYAYAPPAPDITFSSGAGLAANGSDWHFPPPWHGNQVAFVQANNNDAGAIQMRALRLVPGRTYRLAFAASRRPDYPENSIHVFVDGNLVFNASPPTSAQFTALLTQPFVASASSATVRFEATPTPYDSSSGIDAVSIQ